MPEGRYEKFCVKKTRTLQFLTIPAEWQVVSRNCESKVLVFSYSAILMSALRLICRLENY